MTDNQQQTTNNKLFSMRHSCEHVLHQAMVELFPGLKRAMGPATEEGFYLDFDYAGKVTEEDFPKIEKRMAEIIKADLPLIRQEISLEKARKMFKDNLYKLDWIDQIEGKGAKATVYWNGEPEKPGSDVDLCKGPHVESTGKVGPFKLLSLAGAYWHGDEKNKMLTRIYGTCFLTQKELDDYLNMLEEAKKRDHRKLGEQLDIFTIREEVGSGLILWLPKGNIIKEELENWAKQTEKEWGYQRVTTPHITKSGLFYTSGHLPYYKNDMYPPMKLDEGDEYYLKPMNCPFHHMVFSSRPHSYKNLPLRLAEYGTVYRYEASGELFGLMRVRGMAQNDAHIYCTIDQAIDEFYTVMKLHEYYYKVLGITDYHLEIALRDPKKKDKYHGDAKMWELAEKLMRDAVAKTNIRMVEEVGSAAFYGPKIDFIVKSSIGREFAISTNQIDLYMGDRFNLKYIDKTGKEQVPVVIHRAPLGSDERFIGFLLEHFGGAFPTWLSPVQVQIIPITDRNIKYGQKILEELFSSNIRVELDERAEKMQAKIRDAQLQKVPYMLVIGDREEEAGKIALRTREGKDLGALNLREFIDKISGEIKTKSLKLMTNSPE